MVIANLPIEVMFATHGVWMGEKQSKRVGFSARVRGVVAVLFLTLLAFAGGSLAQPSLNPQESTNAFTRHLNEHVPALLRQFDVPGAAIALVRDGEQVWSGAYGLADRAEGRELTTDAVFRVESIAKSVTAWGVMRLVEQGRIELSAPVTRYLDSNSFSGLDEAERAVTVRRLLSHTAGLALGPIGEGAEYDPKGEVPPLREYLSREVRLAQAPGSGFSYSNVGFNLLELVVEEVTGRDFAVYMREAVLQPLGMRQSSFARADSLRPRMPRGYELGGAPVAPYVYPASAGGGMVGTVDDVARFVEAEISESASGGPRVLSPARIRALHRPQIEIPGLYGVVADAYGFGHFLETLPNGERAVWHGGQGHGWMTHFHVVPATGDGIVILTNSERSWPFMARVLTDWAQWSGLGTVKMGRITDATTVLWGLIGLVGLGSLGLLVRLLRGLRSHRRQWAPLSGSVRTARVLQAVLGTGIAAALAWSVAQPYLMMSSIFPTAAGWAGISFLGLAVVLIALALCPRTEA